MMLLVALVSCGVLASSRIQVDNNTPRVYAYLAYVGTSARQMKEYIVGQYESYFHKHEEEAHEEHSKIVVTSPMAKDVIITQQYVCQIHSQRHIEVRALEDGYLEADHGQGGPGGEEGRCDVQDRANSLQGKAGRRDGRGQSSRNWSSITPRSCPTKQGGLSE